MTSLFSATLSQISSAVVERKKPKSSRPNPNPKGIYKQGGATSAVLAVMQQNPESFFTEAQFRWKTGFSHSAVSWALLRMKRNGQVEISSYGPMHPRYCRYRLKPEVSNV